ncbi:uncharacterized protein YbbC (DUF1343 family) [Naumannella cuiyingiana]|uniref:Uncharacterized protein YbbC (DUF1343 family) n=1 Tax=Naumannella cuiyingiana TaxID=1347891 RepID=A0A7Z0IJX3_9ACTN|nr:uncharacterized protein YbbC (DUF1343 family) [Naumannella cuiyingiana]
MTEPELPSIGRRGVLLGAAAAAGVAGLAASGGLGGPTRAGAAGSVRTGADVAAAANWSAFAGQRIGIITNPTGVLSDSLASIVDVMAGSGKVEIGGVFGPEHGFRGSAQAGESEDTYVDERTGVTVYDAYGANDAKFEALFAEADVETVVFDIQDVGARFYTYIWTMYHAMIAAARAGLRFVILDRPNPVGGTARGPLLVDGFTSGVGQDRIVQQHGMTVGELARFFDGEFVAGKAGRRLPALDVIKVEGWQPDQLYAETGLTWVLPSPNMPTPDTALLYPGTGLFEAVNLSEGRGTTRPFELIGAPFMDHRWNARLNDAGLAGVRFREAYFNPTFSKHAGTVCAGVQVHLTEPRRVDAIAVAVTMLCAARDLYADFDWRAEAGGGQKGRWIDLLTGSSRFREQFERGAAPAALIARWRRELTEFDRRRQRYLLYPR